MNNWNVQLYIKSLINPIKNCVWLCPHLMCNQTLIDSINQTFFISEWMDSLEQPSIIRVAHAYMHGEAAG